MVPQVSGVSVVKVSIVKSVYQASVDERLKIHQGYYRNVINMDKKVLSLRKFCVR